MMYSGDTPVYEVINIPKPKWELDIHNGYIVIQKDTAPNFFHRWTHKVFFGFKWRKL